MRDERWGGWWAAAAVGVVVLACVVIPGAEVVWAVGSGLARGESVALVKPALVWRTAWACGLIAIIATVLAAPAGWAMRRVGARWAGLLVAPLLLPSYLAYAGWGLLRGPGTVLGDFLLRGPAGAGAGGNWYPIAASRVQAIMGMALWAWPLAAIVMGAAFRRIDESVLETMRLDGAGRLRRGAEVVKMAAGGIAGGAGLVFLVMLGSAVPLHVAQFDTLAIGIWRTLDETPYAEQWKVWAWGWPLLGAALLAAGVLMWRMRVAGGEGGGPVRLPVARGRVGGRGGGGLRALMTPGVLLAWGAWGLSVVVPGALLVRDAWGAGGMRQVARFVRVNRDSIGSSLMLAAGMAGVGAAIIALAWMARSGGARARRWIGVMAAALLAAGLCPGVLVGSAAAHAWNEPWLRFVWDSPLIVVLVQTARFGFIAALLGIALARAEGGELRDMRRMDAGDSPRGWLLAALPANAGAAVAGALAVGLLSFHEIEATVMVQPASSSGGGFAWRVLQALHFNREDDLVASMVLVLGVGVVVAGVVAGVWGEEGREGGT